MSVQLYLEDVQVLEFVPVEFRRVHLLKDEKLKYSHSELIVTINNHRVLVDIMLTLLDNATYQFKINGLEFLTALNNLDSLQRVKHLVFINFPDLPVSDVYCNQVLQVSSDAF